MLENLPFKTLCHQGVTVEGYSRAAVQTYWRIPEFRLGFDLGGQPWEFMGTPTWFVSHTHLDHIAALPVLVARRRMMKMEPHTVYVPEYAVPAIGAFLRAVSQLDRGRLPCHIIPTSAGETVEVSRELVVTTHATVHTIPSMGFIVWERRKKLKPEFHGLSGDQIRDIRLGGTEVSEERRIPRVAYLGDSTIEGLDRNPEMYQAEILIMETTFVAPRHRKEKIRKLGHIHLSDVLERAERFQNQVIIASHFSARYHQKQIERRIERVLPAALRERFHPWI